MNLKELMVLNCFELSNAQKRTIITEINNPGNEAYIISFKTRFVLDDEKYVKNALEKVISGNLNLRMKKDKNMNFMQYQEDNKDLLESLDLSDRDDAEIEAFIHKFSKKPFKEIFDAPLYRFALIKTQRELIVVGSVHHLIMDGTSINIFNTNLKNCVTALKNGEEYHPPNISYETYVKKEREYLKSEAAAKDEKFWLDNLEGYSKDWYSSDNHDINRKSYNIEPELTEKLKDLSTIYGVRISPFVLSLSVVSLYFTKSMQTKDMVWNTVYHGRDFGEDVQAMMGMFVNMMPLRLKYDKNMTFKDLLLYTKSVLKNGLIHGKLSFNEYGSKLQQMGMEPAMLSMYSMVSNSTATNTEYILNNSTSEFPFHIRVNPSLNDEDGLQLLEIEYNTDCFPGTQVSNIIKSLESLFREVANDPNKILDDIEVELSEFYSAENYFTNMMKHSNDATTLSTDIIGQESTGTINKSQISVNKSDIKEFSLENNIIPEDLFLSATLFTLVKFVFTKDILISILSSNQYLGQELPFAFNIDTSKTVQNYLKEVNYFASEVMSYDYYPFTKIKGEKYIPPEILFGYGVAVLNNDPDKNSHKVTVYIDDAADDAFKVTLHYNDALYSRNLVDAFLTGITTSLENFIKNPDRVLADISMLKEEAKSDSFTIKPVDEPLLNKLFETQVQLHGDEIALTATDAELTYNELNQKSNKIANALIKRGVDVEDRIMFMLKRDSRLIAAMLGIVKAGCAFIPVDPEYPPERIKHFLDDSDAKYIITDEDLPNALSVDELLREENDENPTPVLTPENLCFIIYTSGSTGKPKGVMLTHGGITNYISAHPQNSPIHALVNRSTRMISISTVSFIVFLREIFATIMNGMPVVFANEEESVNPLELVKLFEKTGADAFGATPTRLLQYLEIEEFQAMVARCKLIIVGGETFPPQLYNTLSKHTQALIYNSYGPTEITIASHGKLITSDDISAGEPLLNVTYKVMDIDANPLPSGVVGELYIAGQGVARGYWNNPELTRERFIHYNDMRYYNTGDLAKNDFNGELYVLGRMDNQIKLRGLRIELGEIESAITEYSGVKSVFVVVKEVGDTEHLCAYFTQDSKVDTGDLRNVLLNKLPAYMVPSYFVCMDCFPMTFNGKTDIMNFPLPGVNDYQSQELLAPETDLEREIYNMCSDILEADDFSVLTDLFLLGLTSLSVLKLVTKISKKFGVVVNVTSIMRARTIREIANQVADSTVEEKKYYEKQDFYPLTQNQLGVYFDCSKDPEKLIYNLPKFIDFGPDVDAQKLKEAIINAVDKHCYIKTRLVMKDGEVYQERRDDLDVSVMIHEGEVDDDIKNKFIKPFSLNDGPLYRFEIYKTSNGTSLLADFHHIILDGTSLNILFNEIATIYDGGVVDTEEYDGFDYSLEEQNIEKSKLYQDAESYFETKIRDFESSTVVSPDINGKEEEGQLGLCNITVDKTKVERFCKANAITPNNLFLAATAFTLSKFVYNKNILISTISNGRSNPNFQNTLGMMVKTLPITLNINSNTKTSEYFDYVENIWLDVLKYDCYPFTKIADKYDMLPEFFYAYHGKIIEDIAINGQNIEREGLEYEALKFKLSLNIVDTGNDYNMFSQYNNALYSEELVMNLLNCIDLVVGKFMENPETLLGDISLLPSEAAENFRLKPVEEQLLNKVFEGQVKLHGSETALISKDGEFSYDELNKKANRIANALIKHGVDVEDRIMFMLKRDSKLIATILGIIKAGCAFIPVDPEYPQDRIEYVLKDSDARYIITKADMPGALDIDELLMEENEEDPNPDINPENLCYLIYTSGSTGNPKGVMLTHSNITNYVNPDPKNCYAYGFVNKATRILSITTVSFDLFLHEAFIPLMNGLTLIFADEEEANNPLELVKLFERSKADSFSATPSRMLQYLELDGIVQALGDCKVVTAAGEQYPLQLHKMLVNCTDADIYNVYGPTEATISCNSKHVTDNKITVGLPLLNVVEQVMDPDGNPLPPCVVGELYVGGAGVSRGYWNRETLNNQQFVLLDGVRYYKTGDFARFERNGEISILGRLDNQIKLRGLRIEIGEIENAIAGYQGIKSVTVVVKKVQSNEHLCAYFTADKEIVVDELRDEIKKKLTKYMVPSVFMQLDAMPQTLNGKTDIKSLPEPVLISNYVAPENEAEKFFTETFERILGMSKVGALDNFFDLGGTSLLVTKITIEAMNKEYEIKYGDVFAHPTPRELANFIISGDSVSEEEQYSYDSINAILEKNTLENFINGDREELGNVLLTGATGFLGIHVLRDFLENETGLIYCMLRKGRRTNTEDRLKTLLFYYFSNNYEEEFGYRIRLIEGDITNKQDFEKSLPLPIDTVINCAANVKHFASGTQIEDINIGGVVNGVEFSQRKGCKYVQISTTSVAGESVDNFPTHDTLFDEQTLYVGQALDNKYLSSKFIAERVVLEAVCNGLNGKIMRVGNLMARNSDSEFQINFETNGFINRLKAYGAIEKIPYSVMAGEVELTPIDSTARAILTLSRTPKECSVFHTFNNHNIYIADIVEIMNSVGFNIEGAEEKEFNQVFNRVSTDESKQDAISGLVTTVGMGKGKGRALVKVINNYTIQILYRLGYKWPLISDEYLVMFIKYLKDMNFFD